jgi:hypothetical protein
MTTFNEKGFITALEPNEIFVFGSNLLGEHHGGAANQAHKEFGALWGVGVGISGQSYAIPTMEISLENIALYIAQFIDYAKLTPDKTYYVTPIGTGIAGFSHEEMNEVWSRFNLPTNIILL